MVFNAFSQFIDFIFRILVPQPGIEPGPMAVKAPSPNHWTTKELSYQFFFNLKVFFFYLYIYFWLCWVFVAVWGLLFSCSESMAQYGLSCSTAGGIIAGPRIKPVSPALAGGFFTTEPPGNAPISFWNKTNNHPVLGVTPLTSFHSVCPCTGGVRWAPLSSEI